MKQRLLIIVLLCLHFFAFGQLTEEQEAPLTKADTLRGTLSEFRSCYDVLHYDLTVKVYPDSQFIVGTNIITLQTVTPFLKLQVDLFANMEIKTVAFEDGEELRFKREGNAVFILLPTLVKRNSVHRLRITFSGKPLVAKRPPWDGGFVWEKDKKGNPWIAVACENIGASLWWPCKDHLSDEPDSMRIHLIVPDTLVGVANGFLEGVIPAGNGWHQYNWRVSYPINNYNVTLNVAKYAFFNDHYENENGNLQLNYYVLEENLQKAKKQFTQVQPMLRCFEKYFGEYPFWRDGYKLVETPYLGMEHQSAIAYGNDYLNGYAGMDYSRIGLQFDYIIIHESGHEWWGNSVSCQDIADLWIHEGFCTYSEALYVECLHGRDTALAYINAKKAYVENTQPIIGIYNVNREGSADMYSKGMLMLHTLRSVIADDSLWFSIIKGIATDFKYKTVTTQEIENYISGKAGMDLKYFFDQYLRHTAIPVFEYQLQQKNKVLKYRWAADVPDFRMPVDVTTAPGSYTRIEPATEWKELPLSLGKRDTFRVAENLFYVNVKDVGK